MCSRNLITRLTPAASPRVDISSTCKVGKKLWVSLPLLTCSPSAWPSRLLYRRGRKSRRDLWIRSRYSEWLRAGRSGDRIPVGGGEIFRTRPHRAWGPPSLLYNGYRVFPGGKERPRRDADPSPPSSAVAKKGYSYTPTPPMGRTACTEPQCLYKGALLTVRTLIIKPSNVREGI